MSKSSVDFAFLVHSRDRSDLPRKYPILKILPSWIFDQLTLRLPPFIVSRITGLTGINGEPKAGVVIGIPMTAHQLLEHRERAVRKIVEAVELAKRHGAKFIGLGAMTASLSRGGKDVIERVPDVYVTTGRTYTVKNITEYVEFAIQKFKLDRNTVQIGIVGAAGGIGGGVAVSLARKGYKKFVLIDLERKLGHLQKHIQNIEKHAANLETRIAHTVSAVTPCDIIVAATSAPEVVIRSEDVRPGTIIINDAQPSDVSPEIIRNRSDVIVIEGGVLHAEKIDCHFNFGLVERNDIFSCLAETLWLTYRDIQAHHSMEGFDADLYETLEADSKALRFGISRPQNSRGYVSDQQMTEFAKILERQRTNP